MFEIIHLKKRYPSNKEDTLKDISLTLPSHGLFYFIGKSGAGKSTLIQLLGLADEDYEGKILFNGKDLKEFTEEEKASYRFEDVSFVFQSYHAEDKESVKENLLKIFAITSLSKKEKNEKIKEALSLVDLPEKENQLFKNLSGGEKKRIALARGILKESKVLLVDEPLANLNADLRKKMTKVLQKESERRLVIIITHEKEEIPDSATIYEMTNGRIHEKRRGVLPPKREEKENYQRRKYGFREMLHPLWIALKIKREFLVITLFALMVGLFSISFSFQLSSNVSSAMQKSMQSYMDENCMVVSKKDNSLSSTSFENPDYATLNRLRRNHSSYILGITSFYQTGFDGIFNDSQLLSIQFNRKSLNLEKLSLNSFLEYRMPEEVIEKTIYTDLSSMSEEDIILALDENQIIALYSMMFDTRIHQVSEEDMEKLARQIENNLVQFRIQADKVDWRYNMDYLYRIKGIILDKKNYLINPSETFANHFVMDIMHFEEINVDEDIDEKKPWTLKKYDGFRLKVNTSGEFLKSFLEDKEANDYTLEMFKTPNYYEKNDATTHNHVLVVKDYLPKIHLDEINDFIKENQKDIQGINYSSPVYTYTASGYISGFAKPFFFSKYKEKLNQIEDESTYSEKDLGQLQGSLIEEIPGVIKADLLTSMNQKEGLSFVSLDQTALKPYYGKNPSRYDEIGISKKMAETLFYSATGALGKNLCTLTLDRTVKTNGRYKNEFTQGSVKITGIYDSEKISIYQDSLFPLCYSFSCGELTCQETRIEQVILKTDLSSHTIEEYQNRIRKSGDYTGSYPMYLMIQEIKKTLNRLSSLFFGFAILSLVSASCLLLLSLYLIITKDKKEIGILLSLGYTKKEISSFYLLLSQSIGFFGFIGSLFLSLLTEVILSKTLTDLLSSYSFSIMPFLISFLVSFLLTTMIGTLLSGKLKNATVMDGFR